MLDRCLETLLVVGLNLGRSLFTKFEKSSSIVEFDVHRAHTFFGAKFRWFRLWDSLEILQWRIEIHWKPARDPLKTRSRSVEDFVAILRWFGSLEAFRFDNSGVNKRRWTKACSGRFLQDSWLLLQQWDRFESDGDGRIRRVAHVLTGEAK